MTYRIGIDAGSKTIKVVVLDDRGNIAHSVYQRHRAAVRDTLAEVLHNLVWCYGDKIGRVAITGSAGMGLAKVLGLPFVQEVVATTKAIRQDIPDADVVIELGGEDAKVIYLTGGLEQRMNATCAGGTGGFIDTIAFMLGTQSSEMSSLALGANHTYPIASRCAVFAQTDVRPLLNAGASRSDIAASALDAVVRQTLGGLCCGRPIRGKVVFLGGPLEHIPELVNRFRSALDLDWKTGVKPAEAHLFTAKGAAYAAGDDEAPLISLKVLERRVSACANPEDDLGRLLPLFSSAAERDAFLHRHRACVLPRCSVYEYEGPAYLGIDAGSTAVKLALVDPEGRLLYSDYQPVKGDSLTAVREMLTVMHRSLPKGYGGGEPLIRIAQSCVTGYGEDLLKAALGLDSGVVETMAHTKAALALDPQASFVLDIGGQDIKAIWLEDGRVTDVVLNEACSSGCGSFMEGAAYSLGSRPELFSKAALNAESPIDLGTKCTVFMTSRVRHAQKIGASLGDIAAGAAYSVVQNALFRIIGREKAAHMGNHIVVQGGAFKSDAVLRAFEKTAGVKALRPDTAHLMGALGAALFARDRALMLEERTSKPSCSSMLNEEQREALRVRSSPAVCPGCSNSCHLTVVSFGDGRCYIGGNRCSGAGEHFPGVAEEEREKAPNGVASLQSALRKYCSAASGDPVLGGLRLGLPNVLNMYEQLPFWHTLLLKLGFSVELPEEGRCSQLASRAAESIPSESVCQAAKLSHRRVYALLEQGVKAVLMPRFSQKGGCMVEACYADALADSLAGVFDGGAPLLCPSLEGIRLEEISSNPQDLHTLRTALEEVCLTKEQSSLMGQRFDDAVQAALAEQAHFEANMRRNATAVLNWVHASSARHGVVLSGRSYHMDPELIHGIDLAASRLGLAVLSPLSLGLGQLGSSPSAPSEWEPLARFHSMVEAAAADPQIELICLESFGCGFDAINLELIKDELSAAGKTFTSLKLDDIVDLAHVRIRLRTLAESLEARPIKTPVESVIADEGATSILYKIDPDYGRPFSGKAGPLDGALEYVDPPLGMPPPPGATEGGSCGTQVPASGFSQRNLELAREKMPSGMCIVAAVLGASCTKEGRGAIPADCLFVPRVCRGCLLESLPALLGKLGECNTLSWVEPAESDLCTEGIKAVELPPRKNDDPLRIGVLGNALLCFEPLFNDGLVDLLRELGCQPLLPDPRLLEDEDVAFQRQLQRFREQEADHVIYLQAFGCLKGHVQLRGSLHRLAREYPELPLTVIDYDPEASALNRENRVRLAVEAARERRPSAGRLPVAVARRYSWLGKAQELADEGSCRLACGESPFQGDKTVALAYVLEEGLLKNEDLCSVEQARLLLEMEKDKLLERILTFAVG